ncbi:hypothetical protein AXF42_Ash016685 [Apostasia shenzhenica]|uniref:Uncharacterized protein n=1 Tax=Apostasia shenzhenica TaxID=1088818 RepID=A0A2I0AQ09_9ASPA|nr:hypothetical protein AXF42_Ash016685 [Apostasia shenzhenica]
MRWLIAVLSQFYLCSEDCGSSGILSLVSVVLINLDQVCIDVVVQRLGDATAAGMYKLLFGNLDKKPSSVSLYALPVS